MKENYSSNPAAMKVAAWRLSNPSSTLEEGIKALQSEVSADEVKAQWAAVDDLYEKSGGAHFHFRGKATEQAAVELFKEHGL